jgi:Predicted Zn-dependent proteases and their inactivated homologs
MNDNFPELKPIDRRRFLLLGFQGSLALAASPLLIKKLLAGSEAHQLDLSPEILKKAIAAALKRGGDFADIYVENRISRTIILEEGKFKSAVFGLIQGAGVRVIDGNKTGYAYTDELSDEKILRAAEVASLIASSGNKIQPVSVKEQKRPSYITVKIPLQEVTDSKRMEIMQRAHEAALSYDPRIKMASINYYDEIRDRIIANSEGILLKSSLPLIFFIVQTLAVGNNTSHLGRERLSRHSGLEMFDDLPPEKAAREAARESVAMLEAKDAPARQDGRGNSERLGRRAGS